MLENKENNTLISIIIPVYNLEEYIERCISSIINQTEKNLEIIIVNDGSTDNSWEVIQKLEKTDKRIVSINKKNEGVTSARLAGMKRATGEWIGFVDGDDEIEVDMYELLLGNAMKYHADISHCGYQMVFEDGRIHYFHNTRCIQQHGRITGLKELLEGSRIEPGLCNKLYHRTLFCDLLYSERMPLDIKINEDLLMNYFLFSQAKVSVFEDVCKYHYIVRRSSASRSKLNDHMIFDPIRVKQIILEQSEEDMKKASKIAYINTCINMYNILSLEKGKMYHVEKLKVKKLIGENKEYFPILGKKMRILAYMIYYMPYLHFVVYKIYTKYFQIQKYN